VQFTRKVLSTREGTFGFAILTAIAAVVLILVFMSGYRRSVDNGAQPVTVLVAAEAMPKDTSGDVIAAKGLFRATGLKRDQLEQGAITDPAALRGKVAVHDLVKGQQLTTADFAPSSDPVQTKLGAQQRAITIPLDAAHGMVGQIETGDHVDVYAGFEVQGEGASRPRPVLRTLLQDVEVLSAPAAPKQTGIGASNQVQNIVLRVPEARANELAFSVDNGKVWLVLRPAAGAKQSAPSLVTLDRLLLGMPPIPVDKFLAKKRGLINQLYQGGF
jgi:Flp pilus assembly protein CpaB